MTLNELPREQIRVTLETKATKETGTKHRKTEQKQYFKIRVNKTQDKGTCITKAKECARCDDENSQTSVVDTDLCKWLDFSQTSTLTAGIEARSVWVAVFLFPVLKSSCQSSRTGFVFSIKRDFRWLQPTITLGFFNKESYDRIRSLLVFSSEFSTL